MNYNGKSLNILFVENNILRTESFLNSINDMRDSEILLEDANVTIARHMEDALECMEKQQYDVILLDIILPIDQKKLDELEDLEQERLYLMQQLLKYSSDEKVDELTSEIVRLRRKINEIEDIIDNDIQDIEGGYTILMKYLNNHNLKFYDRVVLFLSARGQSELKNQCKALIKDEHKYAWLVKPISDDDIIERMIRILKNIK
jgi:CheY-like chemotaxis protein